MCFLFIFMCNYICILKFTCMYCNVFMPMLINTPCKDVLCTSKDCPIFYMRKKVCKGHELLGAGVEYLVGGVEYLLGVEYFGSGIEYTDLNPVTGAEGFE